MDGDELTLPRALLASVEAQGDRPALVRPDGQVVSYRAMLDRALRAGAALRGRWVDNHTFVARELNLGTIEETEYRLEFSGDQVKMHVAETVFGNQSVDLTGTAR